MGHLVRSLPGVACIIDDCHHLRRAFTVERRRSAERIGKYGRLKMA